MGTLSKKKRLYSFRDLFCFFCLSALSSRLCLLGSLGFWSRLLVSALSAPLCLLGFCLLGFCLLGSVFSALSSRLCLLGSVFSALSSRLCLLSSVFSALSARLDRFFCLCLGAMPYTLCSRYPTLNLALTLTPTLDLTLTLYP